MCDCLCVYRMVHFSLLSFVCESNVNSTHRLNATLHRDSITLRRKKIVQWTHCYDWALENERQSLYILYTWPIVRIDRGRWARAPTCVCYFFEMNGTKRQAEKKTQDTTHVKGYFISTINRISIHIICCFCRRRRRRRIEVFGRSIESVQSSCKRYFHSWTEAKVSLDCDSMLV